MHRLAKGTALHLHLSLQLTIELVYGLTERCTCLPQHLLLPGKLRVFVRLLRLLELFSLDTKDLLKLSDLVQCPGSVSGA
jgi:hypothetical protein